jgi:hypothetical protein
MMAARHGKGKKKKQTPRVLELLTVDRLIIINPPWRTPTITGKEGK